MSDHATKLDTARRELAALTDPLARRILDLHSESEGGNLVGKHCGSCIYWGDDMHPWPCPTVEAVAAHYGIELQ